MPITATVELIEHRRQFLVERVHRLGPRAIYELLLELTARRGGLEVLDQRLEVYGRIDPDILRTVGGDRFPRRLRVAP